MTSRATFGDFIRAADQHLGRAFAGLAAARTSADAPAQIREATTALHRLVAVINRYAADLAPTVRQVPERDRPLMTIWGRASIQAREALEHACALLRPAGSGWEPGPDHADPAPFSRELDSAATALEIGRDLLGTHFITSTDGVRQGHSEWAPVIDSGPISRALLTEVISLGAVAGAHCAGMAWATSPTTPEAVQVHRRLNAAGHQLLVAITAVQSADQADPVRDDARELLHAIPVNAEPERPIPRGGETVTELCDGAIVTAERARRASRSLARDAIWSPATSGTSLRHAAAACAATSYHCEVVLRSLVGHQACQDRADLRAQFLGSADVLCTARVAWLRCARTWDQMTTDAPKVISATAANATDLAWWTGLLAFADAEWTLSRGPSQAARPPESLAASPEDMRRVTAAVHHACDTITRLAQADFRQVQVAARAGRLLVPTSSLNESFDIPHPIARAPACRVGAALATYRDAGAASRVATTAMDQLAATVGAPSRLLTSARKAVAADHADAQHTTRTGDPHAAPQAREVQSMGRSAGQLACRPAPDRLPQRASAATQSEERGVVDAGHKTPLLPRHTASELSKPDAVARTSNVLAARQLRVNATARISTAARSKEPELEP